MFECASKIICPEIVNIFYDFPSENGNISNIFFKLTNGNSCIRSNEKTNNFHLTGAFSDMLFEYKTKQNPYWNYVSINLP